MQHNFIHHQNTIKTNQISIKSIKMYNKKHHILLKTSNHCINNKQYNKLIQMNKKSFSINFLIRNTLNPF